MSSVSTGTGWTDQEHRFPSCSPGKKKTVNITVNCPKSFCYSSTNTHLILPPPQTLSLNLSFTVTFPHSDSLPQTHRLSPSLIHTHSVSHTDSLVLSSSLSHTPTLLLFSCPLFHSSSGARTPLPSHSSHSFILSGRIHMAKPMSYRHQVLCNSVTPLPLFLHPSSCTPTSLCII